MRSKLTAEWFPNVKAEILAGIVVAFALMPEVIGFSIIAGVDPMVGLYASFCISIVIAFVGGRPGMISAAAGSMALVLVGLVKDHGIEYMLAATVLTGIIQLLLGVFRIGQLVKFIPRSVMVGFVNSLAILIFTAQLPSFSGESWPMYAMVAGGLAIIYLFPRITKAIPSPLIAIIVITIIAIYTGSDVKTIGDMGSISNTLPHFFIPDVPFNLETLRIIFPYAISLAFVGLIETLLTAEIVDDTTDTTSNKNKESRGQGIANIVVGFFGGMAGCAMIGQSVINTKYGGRGRLSALIAGTFLMFLIIVLNKIVVQIPLAALVAVMIVVSISTFDWSSLTRLHKLPKTDAVVTVVTVVAVVITHNLAIGVILGIILSAIFFASKISKVQVTEVVHSSLQKMEYKIEGQLFFASVTDFLASFNFKQENITTVDIDLSNAHIWDESGVNAIDKVVLKFHQNGIKTNILGLNPASKTLLNRVTMFNKPGGLN